MVGKFNNNEELMMKPETMMIDDVKYIRADKNTISEPVNGMKYCVVRTYSAGVHIGYIKSFGEKFPQSATLLKSRRLHYWEKSASLSQVAMDGVGSGSRIAMEIPEIELTDVIEVITCSENSAKFFKEAKPWKK